MTVLMKVTIAMLHFMMLKKMMFGWNDKILAAR
jgi:hypothetical protein